MLTMWFITKSVIGVSRLPVLECGTTFHLDAGGWDLPSTLSDNLWKLIYLATEALIDSWIYRRYTNKSIYLSMVCRWPQSQEGDWARPNLCRLARHGPWPGRKWFIRDHVWRGRSKPGCWIVVLVTIAWLTTETKYQSCLHCIIVWSVEAQL